MNPNLMHARILRLIEGEADGQTGGSAGGEDQPQQKDGEPDPTDRTFSQAEVDALIKQRLAQQARNKFGDYAELKEQASKSQTLEERVAAMEKSTQSAERKALLAEIASEYGLSKEDRELMLTGSDEDTLRQQAKRLANDAAKERKRGPVAPKEGNTTKPGVSEEREAARKLFGS